MCKNLKSFWTISTISLLDQNPKNDQNLNKKAYNKILSQAVHLSFEI